MQINNPVRRALLKRELTVGTWIQIGHPAVSEILAEQGYDWIAADCEHSDITIEGLTSVMRGMYGRGVTPMVRVRENDELVIRQALDMGALGVIVPLVHSAEEARQAVASAKYPPQGRRGFCFSRMNDYGAKFDEYLSRANREIAVVVMIESRQGVEEIDSILAVDGVDGVFIGPYDLSGSYGIPGQVDSHIIREAESKVVDACIKAGKSAGKHIVIPTPDNITEAMEKGFTFIAVGVDTLFLSTASERALKVVKSLKRKSKADTGELTTLELKAAL